MSNNSKDWKQQLQKSGLSLENRIARELDTLKIKYIPEVEYERLNPEGIVIKPSFDYLGDNIIEDLSNEHPKDLYFRFIIECEQRFETVKWLFRPQQRSDTFRDSEIILSYNLQAILTSVWQEMNTDNLACRGIEVGANVNEKGVEHAISQVVYAIPYYLLATSDAIDKAEKIKWQRGAVYFLVPVVVTTSKLYQLYADWDEKYRDANNPEDVGKEMPYIIYVEEPWLDLRNHWAWVLNKKRRQLMLERGAGMELGINPFVNNYLTGNWKSWKYCIVVNIDYFSKFITDYMELYRRCYGVFVNRSP